MKPTLTLLNALLLAPLAGLNLSADAAAPTSPDVQTFSADQAILDLRQTPWQYIHDTTTNKLEEVRARNDWKSVTVGRSWDLAGHSELRKGVVWVRTRVFVPADSRGERIAFFCTALGGSGSVYVNGKPVGKRITYAWFFDVPGPFRVEMTDALRYGEENEILVRCDPAGSVRSIGLVGLVCLQRTIPFHRSDDGGIVLDRPVRGSLRVLLHYGDAVLARGNQTEFSAEELATLRIPIYGLREDELISVIPASGMDIGKLRRVDVARLHFTADNRSPSIRCDALPSSVKQFELLRVPLQVTGNYRNPFEPKEVDVTAEICTPSGKTETVHAFFAQDYAPVKVGQHEEILLPIRGLGAPWRFNYRPRETGRHTVRLAVKDRTGRAAFDAGGFEVTLKAARGFLRVSKNDPRFFEFDNGESFYGTGPSGWFRQTENWMFGGNTRWIPIEPHKKYYERKGQNRSTYEYLARWHFGQLYLKGGFIDNYVAWKLDAAVRAMEAKGVYWITYGRPGCGRTYRNSQRGRKANPKPANSAVSCPHVVRQAGLASEEELDFDPGGRIELFHTVSRLADSPAIWVWSCTDEDGAFLPEQLPYHDYIRSLDIYRHPHGIGEGTEGIKHGGDVVLLTDWYNGSFEKCDRTYAKLTGIQAPVLDVEGSVNTWNDLTGIVERLDHIAVGYHNHLWLCLFMKLACGGTEWFNVELDDGNRLFHAKAIAQYLDGEHLTKVRWQIATPEISDKQLRAFALRSERKTLVWIVKPPAKDPTPVVKGAVLKIPVTAPGTYRLEFWDTAQGTVTATQGAEATAGFVACDLPDLGTDIALKAVAMEKP